MNAEEGPTAVRVAAVGDLHIRSNMRDRIGPSLDGLSEAADVLLLAGDLTNGGYLAEAQALVGKLARVDVPVVVVLGNHDHDEEEEDYITELLTEFGTTVLDGSGTVVDVRGVKLGIAGIMGFDGGFGMDYELWSEHVGDKEGDRCRESAARLGEVLAGLDDQGADIRVALTHFSPIPDTLAGETESIYRYLGNELLGQVIDKAGADLAVHGHAHYGTECGVTAGGIPVRNVARFLLGRPYAVYPLVPRG